MIKYFTYILEQEEVQDLLKSKINNIDNILNDILNYNLQLESHILKNLDNFIVEDDLNLTYENIRLFALKQNLILLNESKNGFLKRVIYKMLGVPELAKKAEESGMDYLGRLPGAAANTAARGAAATYVAKKIADHIPHIAVVATVPTVAALNSKHDIKDHHISQGEKVLSKIEKNNK